MIKKRRKKYAFSLIELMAVLVIMSMLGTVAAVQVNKYLKKAKLTTTQANLEVLHNAVQSYFMDTGYYPPEELGLLALVEPPEDVENYDPEGYLKETVIPKDGWNREFIYDPYPENGKPFVIISTGPDGERDTDDDMLSTDG